MDARHFDLVYYIWSELIVGEVAKISFCVRGVSGGGRGRIDGKGERSFDSYSPFRATNDKKGIRGGAIPPGLYRIERPSEYQGDAWDPAAVITPQFLDAQFAGCREFKKVPFEIHGPGEKGSDGCIVIEKTSRTRLLGAVEKAGGATLLVTLNTRPGDLIDRTLSGARTA
ncbi:hypothetical protein [Paraburkholderia oxyphila]|uniref:hypothetical protein n=1 Tax=Paraburkholderia oxyphila TaxID=614212 RepID=UPI0005BB21FD|nr:hypothetical protein [Paraburkholderia oxyphila]